MGDEHLARGTVGCGQYLPALRGGSAEGFFAVDALTRLQYLDDIAGMGPILGTDDNAVGIERNKHRLKISECRQGRTEYLIRRREAQLIVVA